MCIKIKDIQRRVKEKRNQLLIGYHSEDMNFRKCQFLQLGVLKASIKAYLSISHLNAVREDEEMDIK
jgi:hypothetical protein